TRSGAKVLDFGLAVGEAPLIGDETATHSRLTTSGQVVGTLRYMSPEQLHGFAVDGRSDIFALGAVIYEMCTGQPAFDAPSPAGVIAAILEHEPRRIPGIEGAAAEMLWRIVGKCLAKRPADRWPAASEVAEQLRLVARAAARQKPPARPRTPRASRRDSRIKSIAVLPLTDLSGDPGQQFFCDGITEALTVVLSQFRSLRVISRTSAMQYQTARKPMPEIARDLDVDGVL